MIALLQTLRNSILCVAPVKSGRVPLGPSPSCDRNPTMHVAAFVR